MYIQHCSKTLAYNYGVWQKFACHNYHCFSKLRARSVQRSCKADTDTDCENDSKIVLAH
jgi:hypothetical protein